MNLKLSKPGELCPGCKDGIIKLRGTIQESSEEIKEVFCDKCGLTDFISSPNEEQTKK